MDLSSKSQISIGCFKMDFPQKGSYWFSEPGRRRCREQEATDVENKNKTNARA